MHYFRRIIDFYVFSNIHVALGVFCFVKVTQFLYQVEDNQVALFAFFGTVLGYNFIRFLNVSNHKDWMTEWFVKNRLSLLIFSAGCLAACGFLLKGISINAMLTLAPFFVITFLYGVSFPTSAWSLRRVPGVKIFLIAFCFSGITVLFPLVQNLVEISSDVWVLFVQRILFVVLITIPFDIRDVDFDSDALQTIPQKFGVKNAKLLGIGLALFCMIIEWFVLNHDAAVSIVCSVIVLCALGLLWNANTKQSKYYSSFWVEGIPLYWFLLLWLTS